MGLGISFEVVLAFSFGLILLYLAGWLLLVPLKILLKLLISALVGAAALIVINAVGGIFGVTVGINPVTALVVGGLGIPGVILLFVIKLILGV